MELVCGCVGEAVDEGDGEYVLSAEEGGRRFRVAYRPRSGVANGGCAAGGGGGEECEAVFALTTGALGP